MKGLLTFPIKIYTIEAIFALVLTIVVYTGFVTVWLSVKLHPLRLIMIFAPRFWD